MSPQVVLERCEASWQVSRLGTALQTTSPPELLPSEPLPSSERRRHPRHMVARHRALAIPLLPDGQLDWRSHAEGQVVDVSAQGLGIEFDRIVWPDAPNWLIGVVTPSGVVQFTGIEVRNRAGRSDCSRLRVGGQIGGLGSEILLNVERVPILPEHAGNLAPRVNDSAIESWVEHGILEPVPFDRVLLCPQCRGLPTFRRGCACCGSSRVQAERLIHHFPCAHVGRITEFESAHGLVCPKCRRTALVVGADYEYAAGPFLCADCSWSSSDLELVGHCPRCSLRFPEFQAHEQELRGFRVNRLDPLALVSTQ